MDAKLTAIIKGGGNVKSSPLPFDNVCNGVVEILLIPQIPRASVPRPDPFLRSGGPGFPKTPRRPRFERVHRHLGRAVSRDDDVNVVRTHVEREQRPGPVFANAVYRVRDDWRCRSVKCGVSFFMAARSVATRSGFGATGD